MKLKSKILQSVCGQIYEIQGQTANNLDWVASLWYTRLISRRFFWKQLFLVYDKLKFRFTLLTWSSIDYNTASVSESHHVFTCLFYLQGAEWFTGSHHVSKILVESPLGSPVRYPDILLGNHQIHMQIHAQREFRKRSQKLTDIDCEIWKSYRGKYKSRKNSCLTSSKRIWEPEPIEVRNPKNIQKRSELCVVRWRMIKVQKYKVL